MSPSDHPLAYFFPSGFIAVVLETIVTLSLSTSFFPCPLSPLYAVSHPQNGSQTRFIKISSNALQPTRPLSWILLTSACSTSQWHLDTVVTSSCFSSCFIVTSCAGFLLLLTLKFWLCSQLRPWPCSSTVLFFILRHCEVFH